MHGMKVIELLEVLAHDRSDPVVYFASKTLPDSGAATDPNAGTLGDGLAVPVPSWAVNAMVFITYAIGVGGDANTGTADAYVWTAPAVGEDLAQLSPAIGSSTIDVNGASFMVAGIGGAGTIGLRLFEAGDTAHPGIVGVKFVFSR